MFANRNAKDSHTFGQKLVTEARSFGLKNHIQLLNKNSKPFIANKKQADDKKSELEK